MPKDPYAVLGLTKTATADDIKKAYRKLVRSSHPDLNPDDPTAEAKFKAISAAYDILKDPETRARFDAGEIDGSGAERPPRQYYRDFAEAGGGAYHPQGGFGAQGDPADIFEQILRSRARASGGDPFGRGSFSAAGDDARYSMSVSFMDAVHGTESRITLPDGQNLAVKIPEGTEDGQTLRLRGKGGPGFGDGPAGDALITISVRPDPVFQREGDDILLTLPISFDEAILGGKVTTPTIDGPVGLNIPAGASSGRVMRLRGRGVARKGRAKGDQKVTLQVVVPKDIDDGLREFLTEWRKTHPFDPRADMLKGGKS